MIDRKNSHTESLIEESTLSFCASEYARQTHSAVSHILYNIVHEILMAIWWLMKIHRWENDSKNGN